MHESLLNAISMTQRALHAPNYLAKKYLARAAEHLNEVTVMSQMAGVPSPLETLDGKKNY
jgi:hypothetical protein